MTPTKNNQNTLNFFMKKNFSRVRNNPTKLKEIKKKRNKKENTNK